MAIEPREGEAPKDVGTEETKPGQTEVVAGTPEHEEVLKSYPNATSYGPEVNVVLPPEPTPSPEATQMAKEAQTEEDAQAAIAAAGYSNVENLEQHGHSWHADATDADGNAVSVVVDGGSGAVHQKGEGDEPEVEHH